MNPDEWQALLCMIPLCAVLVIYILQWVEERKVYQMSLYKAMKAWEKQEREAVEKNFYSPCIHYTPREEECVDCSQDGKRECYESEPGSQHGGCCCQCGFYDCNCGERSWLEPPVEK